MRLPKTITSAKAFSEDTQTVTMGSRSTVFAEWHTFDPLNPVGEHSGIDVASLTMPGTSWWAQVNTFRVDCMISSLAIASVVASD
jgi:hypothetical protein